MTELRILIETGSKKTFASARDWPGWSRSGRDEGDAIMTLIAYADRYRVVTDLAGITDPLPDESVVIDRRAGDVTTDFGAPGQIHDLERTPIADDELDRYTALLNAAWDVFFAVAARVTPELQKGPRGGGRDRDEIIAHVVEVDRSYARQIGVRTSPFAVDPLDRAALDVHREAVLAAIPAFTNGAPRTEKGWPLRYLLRRMTWHILDHAWEMEDKTLA